MQLISFMEEPAIAARGYRAKGAVGFIANVHWLYKHVKLSQSRLK
ncbi:hypothetical protein [Stenomitos frigidus]|nr:hypothetical protein [Stenomitos frigidus]